MNFLGFKIFKALLLVTTLAILSFLLLQTQKTTQKKPDPRFGIFNDYVIDASKKRINIDLAKELSSGSSRLTLPWWKVEPKKGKFDFTIYDTILQTHSENKITTIVTLLSRSNWATKSGGSKEKSAPPKNWSEYEKFISSVVSRYENDVDYWQIENEVGDNPKVPSKFWNGSKEDYLNLLKHAYKIIKKEDPNSKVVLQGFSNRMFAEIKNENELAITFFNFFMNDCSKYFDVVDFHQYYEPYDAIFEIETIKSTMEKYGYKKEIISTEAGDLDLRLIQKYRNNERLESDIVNKLFNENDFQNYLRKNIDSNKGLLMNTAVFLKNNPSTRSLLEEYQAESLVKRYLINLSRDIDQIHWLGIKDKPADNSPGWYWSIIPFVDSDGRKKPHFFTYKLLIEKMKNAKDIEEISQHPWIYKAEFENQKTLYVAWNESEVEIELNSLDIDGGYTITEIITEQGKREAEKKFYSRKKIKLKKAPIFIEQ